jgi:hypothetical protein
LAKYIKETGIPEVRGPSYPVHPWNRLDILRLIIVVLFLNLIKNFKLELREREEERLKTGKSGEGQGNPKVHEKQE